MTALLSLAWWGQRLSGVAGQALAIAAATAVVIGLLVGGLWWLRHDARKDAQAQCDIRIWTIEKAINNAAQERIAHAQGAAVNVEPAPAGAAALERMCAADPNCRRRR